MAKAKTTKVAEVDPNQEPAAPKAPAAEKGMADVFVRTLDASGAPSAPVKEDGTVKRLAPQLVVIAEEIAQAGESGITRKDLIAALETSGALKTKQPVGRIVSYYQKDLERYQIATKVTATA